MLFYLDKEDKTVLTSVQPTTLQKLGWLEKDLENLVAKYIDRIVREDQLLVIHQQRQHQEEPDILALDKEGNLHIFELKRWGSNQENLLQVLRYGQIFGQYGYDALDHLFQRYLMRIGEGKQGKHKHLVEAHKQYFEMPEELPLSAFNQHQRFIIVTNGLDRQTREAISYWGNHGLSITALTYQVYKTLKGDLLFEVSPYGPAGDTFIEAPEGLVVVNTNATYMPDAWKDMFHQGRASAYYGRKTAVRSIAQGSPIALYHTGVGIVAFGKTIGPCVDAPHGDDPEGEYYVRCDFEFTVDPSKDPEKAVTAREVNDFLGASHRFRLTVYTLPQEAVKFVRDTLKKKQDGSYWT
jgi:hypothetical protein